MNKFQCMGRLVSDPEMRISEKGREIVYFTVAVSEKYKDSEKTDFIDFVAFGPKAEVIANHFKKGQRMLIVDSKYNSYTKEVDGARQYRHNFIVNDFEFVEKKGE